MAQAEAALDNLDQVAGALVAPLQQIAVASLSVVGTMLIVFFLSIYMVLDRDAILAFLFRIVPPSLRRGGAPARDVGLALVRRVPARPGADGRRLLPRSPSAPASSLGLPLAVLTSVAAGLLMAIPFFGPFVSWAPPVIVALVLQPERVAAGAHPRWALGWFVVMNVLQPRIMQGAVGIHPIVVLGSVLIGGADRRHPRAPSSASRSRRSCRRSSSSSCSRTSGDRSVAGRAAQRLEEREGRPVRIPREPVPGQRDRHRRAGRAGATDLAEPDEASAPT